jgi:hypothetical protein
MALVIKGLAAASAKGKLNEEWMLVHNDSDRTFNMDGLSITSGRGGGRPRVVHTFKAGLVMQPDETVRLVTGSSGKKSHGAAPEEDGVRNAALFLKAAYLNGAGINIRITRRQVEMCKVVFDPKGENGLKG